MAALELDALAREFADYQLELSHSQLLEVQSYLDLLLRWNRRVNLTAIREPRRMVRELFCESIYLTRVLPLSGRLIDIGSGAGFPGLALKLAVPNLGVVLVESSQRKCAFLRELAYSLHLSEVSIENVRFSAENHIGAFECVTTRAVAIDDVILHAASKSLNASGCIALFGSLVVCAKAMQGSARFNWGSPVPIPYSRSRVILVGRKA